MMHHRRGHRSARQRRGLPNRTRRAWSSRLCSIPIGSTFFTTSDLEAVTANKAHRGHAIIEQVNAGLKDSALAHLPPGKFNTSAAWLVLAVIAFNSTRAAATLAGAGLSAARTGTIRAKLISVPARVATSARKMILHLPSRWPWETA